MSNCFQIENCEPLSMPQSVSIRPRSAPRHRARLAVGSHHARSTHITLLGSCPLQPQRNVDSHHRYESTLVGRAPHDSTYLLILDLSRTLRNRPRTVVHGRSLCGIQQASERSMGSRDSIRSRSAHPEVPAFPISLPFMPHTAY